MNFVIFFIIVAIAQKLTELLTISSADIMAETQTSHFIEKELRQKPLLTV
jgi:hypothetical protein